MCFRKNERNRIGKQEAEENDIMQEKQQKALDTALNMSLIF